MDNGADDGDADRNWIVYNGSQVSEWVKSAIDYTDVAYDDGTDHPAMEYIHRAPSDEWHAEVIDPMGNVAGAVVLDSIGIPYTYDAWGRNTSATWAGSEVLGWKGLETATATGLIYMRARWYDPALGRFISEDPAGLEGGMNQYAFAGDDPINASDPSGLYSCAGVTINATSCGDPLQFPGSISAAAYGVFGGGGGDVSYGGVSGIAVSGGFGFGNDVNHKLRDAWSSATAAIEILASNGDMLAQMVLNAIHNVERSSVLFLFENVSLNGHYGQTVTGFPLMLIDEAAINANTTDAVTIPSTMVHEFGHAYYQFTTADELYDMGTSRAQAMYFDNAYRRAVGMPERPNHGTYPQLPNR